MQAIRCVVFLVCYPVLKYTGYSITLRQAAVMVWAGLRGAVGLALSMFLLFDGRVSDRSFRLLAFFFMGMIAAITILVQGTTTSWLLEVTLVPPFCCGMLFVPQFDGLYADASASWWSASSIIACCFACQGSRKESDMVMIKFICLVARFLWFWSAGIAI